MSKSRPPKYDPLRPIGARALKSARDTLRPYLSEARVLDLYAGQGRFGIAALEEGAREVIFVERDKRATAALSKAVARAGERARVLTSDVFAYFARPPEAFSIVFADPPFPDWNEPTFAARLFSGASARLEPEGIFLVKCPSRMVLSPPVQPSGMLDEPALEAAAGESKRLPGASLQHWKTVAFGESTLAYFVYGTD